MIEKSSELTLNHLSKSATDILGLKWKPSLEPGISDDQDHIFYYTSDIKWEISLENLDIIKQLIVNNNFNSIMEIGVHRNGDDSFTGAIFSNKSQNCKYLGVDLDDKSFLNDEKQNIFTLISNSHDHSLIRKKLNELGINSLDLLIIDGYHSVNTVLNDWKYSDLLNNGYIVMHDTNCHPGPIAIFDAIDENIYDKQKYCINEDDCGIAVIKKKLSNITFMPSSSDIFLEI